MVVPPFVSLRCLQLVGFLQHARPLKAGLEPVCWHRNNVAVREFDRHRMVILADLHWVTVAIATATENPAASISRKNVIPNVVARLSITVVSF